MPRFPRVDIKECTWVSEPEYQIPSPHHLRAPSWRKELRTSKTTCLMADKLIPRPRSPSRRGSHSTTYPWPISTGCLTHPTGGGRGVHGDNAPRNKTHRRPGIPEQPPIDFGEPFMLLDLTCPTLASQSRKLLLVEQLDNDVFAGPRVGSNSVVSPSLRIEIQQPAKPSSDPTTDKQGTITPGHRMSCDDRSTNPSTKSPTSERITRKNREIKVGQLRRERMYSRRGLG